MTMTEAKDNIVIPSPEYAYSPESEAPDFSEKTSIDNARPASPEDAIQDAIEQGPPNGGYGWVCVACVALINGHTWGINSSYGVFLAHYLSTDTFVGATPLDFAFIGGLSVSQGLLIAPLATLVTRWYGTRVSLLIGLCLETVALIGASFAHQIWHLFLSQGLCFGWGLGFLFVASVGVVPQWFTTKRSMANGLATGGSGLGGMAYSLAANAMIQHLGVGWALRILGICTFSLNMIATILIRDRNHQVGTRQKAFELSLLKRPEYLFLNGWGFFSMLGYIALLFSLPSYASTIGLTMRQGSTVGALLNLGQGLGRPLVGFFSDAAGRINMAGSMTFLCGLLCFVIWIFAKTYGVLIFFAIITGAVCGTYWTTVGPVTAEVVGLKDLPPALSMTWIFIAFPTTFSEVIGLELRRNHGNVFIRAQIFVAAMYVAAALCMWCVRTWKIGELEDHPCHGNAMVNDDAVDHSTSIQVARSAKKGRMQVLRRFFTWAWV